MKVTLNLNSDALAWLDKTRLRFNVNSIDETLSHLIAFQMGFEGHSKKAIEEYQAAIELMNTVEAVSEAVYQEIDGNHKAH